VDAALRQIGFHTVHFKSLPGYWDFFMLAVEASGDSIYYN